MNSDLDLDKIENTVLGLVDMLKAAVTAALDARREIEFIRSQRATENIGYVSADQYRPGSDTSLQQVISAQSEALKEIRVIHKELVVCDEKIQVALKADKNRQQLLRDDQVKLTRGPVANYRKGEVELRRVNTKSLNLLRLIANAIQKARSVCIDLPSTSPGREGNLEGIVGSNRGAGKSAQGQDAVVYGVQGGPQYMVLDGVRYGVPQKPATFTDPSLYRVLPDGYKEYTPLEQAKRGGAISPYGTDVSYNVPLPENVRNVTVDSSSSNQGFYTVLDQYR